MFNTRSIDENMKVTQRLKGGEKILLTSEHLVEFKGLKENGDMIVKLKNKLYKVGVERYRCTLEELREYLKTLKPGDLIKVSTGETVKFIKVNRTKFLAKEGNAEYLYPIPIFTELIQRKQESGREKKIKALALKYKGVTIQTSWGPSVIGELTPCEESVFLYEFGEELYSLSLEDFMSELSSDMNHLEL
ncbi:hypothetical protein [Desertibacillus haloalkaliphilus]|uniref:hypothetical protein n=1 Tax=Desertibacillus haloalkaliphilus TaxID=1328930 RepID=UPI001C254D0C|nr:hypothetical protein [Desertibacillus haloalkaliphilus]MBU8908178.1 hypothetical protein [Desertibacillus haloalkaliphilus]